MPKRFDQCVKAGGRVRTKSLSGNRYVRVCCKGGRDSGKCVAGEVHKKKNAAKNS